MSSRVIVNSSCSCSVRNVMPPGGAVEVATNASHSGGGRHLRSAREPSGLMLMR